MEVCIHASTWKLIISKRNMERYSLSEFFKAWKVDDRKVENNKCIMSTSRRYER